MGGVMETAVKERPILFSGPMVRAILAGRKTQTRRIIKDAGWWNIDDDGAGGPVWPGRENEWGEWVHMNCPYGSVGDRLWVRECFYVDHVDMVDRSPNDECPPDELWKDCTYYRADGDCCEQIPECCCAEVGKPKWRPSIHMPRWASRINLEVTGVRVERLQDITEADANSEGMQDADSLSLTARGAFSDVWDDLNAKRGFSWDSNPWVWVVSFRRIK